MQPVSGRKHADIKDLLWILTGIPRALIVGKKVMQMSKTKKNKTKPSFKKIKLNCYF